MTDCCCRRICLCLNCQPSGRQASSRLPCHDAADDCSARLAAAWRPVHQCTNETHTSQAASEGFALRCRCMLIGARRLLARAVASRCRLNGVWRPSCSACIGHHQMQSALQYILSAPALVSAAGPRVEAAMRGHDAHVGVTCSGEVQNLHLRANSTRACTRVSASAPTLTRCLHNRSQAHRDCALGAVAQFTARYCPY